MATISSPWVGISRGKLGEGVYYHSGGKQRARARNRQPKNPRSAKQAVQRMVLASASKALAALRPLYNHSAEGVSVGQPSIQYWQKVLTDGFRAAAATALQSLGTAGTFTLSEFAIKGAPLVTYYDGMPITHGRLGFTSYEVSDGELLLRASADVVSRIRTQADYTAELAKIGLVPGDQLSLVWIAYDTDSPVASFDGVQNYASIARYCRVTFVSELPSNFDGLLIVDGAFNPALIAEQEGTWPSIRWDDGDTYCTFSFDSILVEGANEYTLFAAAAVRSQKQSSGKYYYSESAFVADASVAQSNAALVYPSYQDASTEIEVGDNLYLQNALLRASAGRPAPAPAQKKMTLTRISGGDWSAEVISGEPFALPALRADDTFVTTLQGEANKPNVSVEGFSVTANPEGVWSLFYQGVDATEGTLCTISW